MSPNAFASTVVSPRVNYARQERKRRADSSRSTALILLESLELGERINVYIDRNVERQTVSCGKQRRSILSK